MIEPAPRLVVDDSERTGRIPRLSDLIHDPELMMPPTAVVPRLAWAGRVTLLAAREKAGKSTLAQAAAAACSTGATFLGLPAQYGRVLYVNVEEHLGDFARKCASFDAEPDNVYVPHRFTAPIRELRQAIHETEPAVVLIDTLPTFVRDLAPESGSAQDWGSVMSQIADMARDTGAAIVLLHHATKVTGEYRDSTAIGAGADMILTMKEDGADASLRRIEPRGRFHLEPYAFHLTGDPMKGEPGSAQIVVSGEPATLEGQILAFLDRHPGSSTSMVREGVTGQAEKIALTLTRLANRGLVEDQGSGNRHKWHRTGGEPKGNGPERVGNGFGTGPGWTPRVLEGGA